jgi:hypothetical protein
MPDMPSDSAKRLVLDAARKGAQFGSVDDQFAKVSEHALSSVGLELARNVQPGERASFCIPVQVVNGSTVDPGAVLFLEHRAVLAWSEGTFPPRPFSAAFGFGEVTQVHAYQRAAGEMSAFHDAVTFVVRGCPIEIILYSEVSHRRLPVMVSDLLSHAIVFHWDARGRAFMHRTDH